MEEDREDDVLMWVTLYAETAAHLARREETTGRTLKEQMRYELEVIHGCALPDPGDFDATQFGQLFRRMVQRRILQG
ncbi:MAG: hypothetical protein ABIQ24_09915 [Nitrospiraceae bacterium]